MKEYQVKGIQVIQKDYEQFCKGISDGLDEGIKYLKNNY